MICQCSECSSVVVSPATLLIWVSQLAPLTLGLPGLKHKTIIENRYIKTGAGNTEHNNKTISAINAKIM